MRLDLVLAAALIMTHATIHAASHPVPPVVKAEKVKQSSISSTGTTED